MNMSITATMNERIERTVSNIFAIQTIANASLTKIHSFAICFSFKSLLPKLLKSKNKPESLFFSGQKPEVKAIVQQLLLLTTNASVYSY